MNMKAIWSHVISVVVATIFVGLGLLVWEGATDGGLIAALKGATEADVEELTTRHEADVAKLTTDYKELKEKALTECRVCFMETKGGPQCQGAKNTCSSWAGIGDEPEWTKPFHDDTDVRPGQCTYQWRVECQ